MKRILTAVVLIPLVLVLVLWAPLWLQTLAAWGVAELALYEYLALSNASGARAPRGLVLACCAILFAVGYWAPGFVLATFALCALALLGICALRSPLNRVLGDAAAAFFGLMYIVFPLMVAPWVTARENGAAELLFVLVVVWAGDIAALCVGRLLGRRPMAPVLSPKKTWEGAAGSMIGSVAAGMGLVAYGSHLYRNGVSLLLYTQPWWYWLCIAILLNIAAQIGDLLESAIKRGAGMKDSGTILPGHGGVLDRIDALLLALPLLWYALLLRPAY
jgi:phosphatidate cytidylyltransferase